MPELPEVETIVRYLRPQLIGRKILDLKSDTRRLFRLARSNREYANPKQIYESLRKEVIGAKIESATRLGKNILFELSGGKCLAIHLMMTGKLLINPKERGKHDRMTIFLSGGSELVFNDIRKFGRCRLISGSRTPLGKSDFRALSVGPDIFSLRFAEFKDQITKCGAAIKNLLVNQKVFAGIGNIYADEILWYAGIGPARKAHTLGKNEIENLYAATQKVLKLAIKKEGTSARDYRKPDGSEGGYYKIRKAYQRTGEKCAKRDGGTIKRIVVGQRATHYCPKHQTRIKKQELRVKVVNFLDS